MVKICTPVSEDVVGSAVRMHACAALSLKEITN